jgi:hypothetical protein
VTAYRHLTYRAPLRCHVGERGRTHRAEGDHPDQPGRRRRWANVGACRGQPRPRGRTQNRPASTRIQTAPTPITTSLNAPRVRAFGSFAAPSPSFPIATTGERGRDPAEQHGNRGQNAPTRTAARRDPEPRTRRAAGRRTKRPAEPAGRRTAEATRPQLGRGASRLGTTGAHVRPRGGVGEGPHTAPGGGASLLVEGLSNARVSL